MTLANWIHPLLFAGRAVWTPLDLPGLALWLDGSQITGVPDLGDISQWDDLSGNARHATQAVALDKPHFREAFQNGLSVVEFDGVNHWMTLDFSTPVPADDHTLIIACQQRDAFTNPDQRFFDFIPPGGELSINAVLPTLGRMGYWQAGWKDVAPAVNGVQIITYQMEAGNAGLFRNGVPISAGGALAQRALSTAVSLGANTVGDYPFDGYLFEAIICSPMLGDANHMLAVNHLLAKWGIANPLTDYLVYDVFLDANDVTLPNHDPDRDAVGGGWISRPSDWRILANTADAPAGGGRRYTTIDAGVTDVRMGLSFILGAGEAVGLVGRCQDDTHCWFYVLAEATNEAAIYIDNAGFVKVASGAYVVNPATWYTIEVRIYGNVHELWVGGVMQATWTGAQFNTETEFGIWSNSPSGSIRADDFWLSAY